ncbi:hypothetical protein [Miniimonas arenae]|nr:hypothetical protein [Miniimonas arenae]
MTLIIAPVLLLTALLVALLAVGLHREVTRDGYGTRPAPRSHHAWNDPA